MNATIIELAPYLAKRDKGKALDPRMTDRIGQIIDPFNRNWGPVMTTGMKSGTGCKGDERTRIAATPNATTP